MTHYDPELPLILECDASPYGVGAVLSHKMKDGLVRPLAFTSHSLTQAEKNYAQLDKEGLAIIVGIIRFHQYIYGRNFTIYSDHKPLQHIFNETKPIPTMPSARIQRWALILNAYNYTIVYKPGSDFPNADLLSRLPLPEVPKETLIPSEIHLLFHKLSYTPLTSKPIKIWTAQDPVLLKVLDLVLTGANLASGTDNLKPFLHRREELSLQDGYLLWGNRVIIPTRARNDILEELHEGHPGVSRMKSIAKGIAWWPGIDHEIEAHVKACPECQQNQKGLASASLHPWEWPSRPWSRLHIDYAGPFLGNMFLVVVDAHSKWMEIEMVPTATSRYTITKLGAMFATHGLPQLIVSDNGTAFTSQEFRDFLRQNGIRHTTTAPYHPASNGLAERCVQTFKRAMKKEVVQDLQYELSKFLFRYRTTPRTTTGITPAQLLMGRQLLTPLGRLHPNLSARVHTAQTAQKIQHDKSSQARHRIKSMSEILGMDQHC